MIGLRHAVAALLIGGLACGAGAEEMLSRSVYVIDGDTVSVNRQKYRLVGFDTPETHDPQCDYEKALGDLATARLRELIERAGAVELVIWPGKDKYGRGLARLFVLGDDVGDTLIAEGLARPYHGGRRSSWCR